MIQCIDLARIIAYGNTLPYYFIAVYFYPLLSHFFLFALSVETKSKTFDQIVITDSYQNETNNIITWGPILVKIQNENAHCIQSLGSNQNFGDN